MPMTGTATWRRFYIPTVRHAAIFIRTPLIPIIFTGLIDESGNLFASWTYDSQGRATSSQHAGGADLTTVAYTNGGGATVTDARGNVHGVDWGCNSGGGAKAFTYNDKGFISSLTDFDGNVTTYVFNDLGEETSRTEAAGTQIKFAWPKDYPSTADPPFSVVFTV
jgi:uncharacterized protein RhaS with RHS repeats